ncbi:MAG: hypothetical protein ACRDJE_01075 [Dehalococcoidia bacterium]
MGLFDRIFGKRGAKDGTTAADQARSEELKLRGHEAGQSPEEQAATRGRMEAEMDAQRQRREQPSMSEP